MCGGNTGHLVVRIFIFLFSVCLVAFNVIAHTTKLVNDWYSELEVCTEWGTRVDSTTGWETSYCVNETVIPAHAEEIKLWRHSADPLFVAVGVFTSVALVGSVITLAFAIALLVFQDCFSRAEAELQRGRGRSIKCLPRFRDERALCICLITFATLVMVCDMVAFAMFMHVFNYIVLGEFCAAPWLMLASAILALMMIFMTAIPVLSGHKILRDPTKAKYFLNHDARLERVAADADAKRREDNAHANAPSREGEYPTEAAGSGNVGAFSPIRA